MIEGTDCRSLRFGRGAITALAFLTPLVFCPFSYDAVELPKLLIAHLLTTAALAGALFAWRRGGTWPISPLTTPILALLGATALATITSAAPCLSLIGAYPEGAGLLRLVDGVLLALLTTLTLRSPSDRQCLYTVITITAAIVSCYGIVQHFGLDFGQWGISEATGTSALRYRSFATLSSPSFLGLYLVMAVPFALSGMSSAANRRKQTAWGTALCVILICLVLTSSRAAWIGCFVGLIVYANIAREPMRRKWLLIVCAIIAGCLLTLHSDYPSAIRRIVSILDMGHGSIHVRFSLWLAAARMVAKRPLLGWGPDTFRYILPRFASASMKAAERRNFSAHNELLDWAAQTGLAGVCAYLWLLTAVTRIGLRAPSCPDPARRQELAVLIASLAAYTVAMQFGFASLTPFLYSWLLLGCLASAVVVPSNRAASRHLVPILGAMTLASTILTAWTFREFVADVAFQRGEMLYEVGDLGAAESEVDKAASLNSVRDCYLARLGQFQEAQGGDPKNSYRAAIRANPLDSTSHALLAGSLQSGGHLEEAIFEWQVAVTLDPRWPQANNALGLLYHQRGENSRAISAYQRAIDSDPTYAIAYNNLGNAYLSSGQTASAVDCYHHALQLQPNWETARHNLEIAESRQHNKSSTDLP